MVNENNLKPIVNQQKLVEEIRELEESSWWKEYQSSISKSNLSTAARNKVISKSGSDFISERGKEGYGPMPFGDEAALMVAKSDSVMRRLRQSYPTIVELFNHNRKGTVEFLKANSALSGYSVVHNFNVPYTDSGNSVKVWRQYKDKIEDYVDKLARNLRDQNGKGYYEQLVPARGNLTEHVHTKYYEKLPRWPSLYCTNIENIYLDTGSSYEHYPYHMVWSCVGLVRVKDERPSYDTFSAEFSGEPELKLLVIDYDELTRLEKIVSNRSLQAAKDMVDEKERTRGLLSWDYLR